MALVVCIEAVLDRDPSMRLAVPARSPSSKLRFRVLCSHSTDMDALGSSL